MPTGPERRAGAPAGRPQGDVPSGDAPSGDAPSGEVVVVPARPGPLVGLDDGGRGRAPDEVDELIDELFGPDDESGPGWFDLGLLASGGGLVAWGTIGGVAAATAVGVAAGGLGLVLPARTAWRALQRRRAAKRRDRVLAGGTPLRVGDPVTARLAASYSAVLAAAGRDGLRGPEAAVRAAHLALTECATLLAGRLPASADEQRYVEARAGAMAELATALGEEHRRWKARSAALDAGGPAAGAAVVAAREELEDMSRFSSVSHLRELAADAREDDAPH